MIQYFRSIKNRRNDDTGASAVEYGLLVALIAAVIVVAVFALGGLVNGAFEDTCSAIEDGGTVTSADCGGEDAAPAGG